MEEFNKDDFPKTYNENSKKEKLVLAYAENFRRQYVNLYRDRKPLFLNPYNECYVEVQHNSSPFSQNLKSDAFEHFFPEQNLRHNKLGLCYCCASEVRVHQYQTITTSVPGVIRLGRCCWVCVGLFGVCAIGSTLRIGKDQVRENFHFFCSQISCKQKQVVVLFCFALFFSSANQNVFVVNCPQEAERTLLRVQHAALLITDWRWIRRLRCQWLCYAWDLPPGWNQGNMPAVEENGRGTSAPEEFAEHICSFIVAFLDCWTKFCFTSAIGTNMRHWHVSGKHWTSAWDFSPYWKG